MQNADQREQTAGRVAVHGDLPIEPFNQKIGPFIMQSPAAHIDRFQLARRAALAHRFIAFDHHEVITDQACIGFNR